MPNGATVQQIHALPFSVLAQAVPSRRPFDVGDELRQEFARWVLGQAQQFDSWQSAWNCWTGASPVRAGRLDLRIRCPNCHGRRLALHHGQFGPCMACVARGSIHVRATTIWLPPPSPS